MANKRPQRPPTTPEGQPVDTPDYNPFLKADNLPNGRASLLLTGWHREVNGMYGPQVIVECSIMGDTTETLYDWAIKIGSPSHRDMFKTFGPDFTKWRGTVTVVAKNGQFGKFIALEKIPF